jgi:hypothetical protein
MILFWNDVKSFNRHLENMRRFRHLQEASARCNWDLIKDMPMPDDVRPPGNAGGVNRSFRRETIVPLWEITIPTSLQN